MPRKVIDGGVGPGHRAGRGLGRVIAERLAADGWVVAVNDLTDEPAEETAATIRAAGGRPADPHRLRPVRPRQPGLVGF